MPRLERLHLVKGPWVKRGAGHDKTEHPEEPAPLRLYCKPAGAKRLDRLPRQVTAQGTLLNRGQQPLRKRNRPEGRANVFQQHDASGRTADASHLSKSGHWVRYGTEREANRNSVEAGIQQREATSLHRGESHRTPEMTRPRACLQQHSMGEIDADNSCRRRRVEGEVEPAADRDLQNISLEFTRKGTPEPAQQEPLGSSYGSIVGRSTAIVEMLDALILFHDILH